MNECVGLTDISYSLTIMRLGLNVVLRVQCALVRVGAQVSVALPLWIRGSHLRWSFCVVKQ